MKPDRTYLEAYSEFLDTFIDNDRKVYRKEEIEKWIHFQIEKYKENYPPRLSILERFDLFWRTK